MAAEDCFAGRLFALDRLVRGYFPAQSEGNDLIVYQPSDRRELLRFSFPRQREGRRLSISDFFAAKKSGEMDVLGLSLVTIGPKLPLKRNACLTAANIPATYIFTA
jgi:cobalamin-dependent methionine synthase I